MSSKKRLRDGTDDADQADLPAKKVHNSEVALEDPGGTVSQAHVSAEKTRNSLPDVIKGENAELGTIRDDEFYIENGDLVLRVENTLFKVHRFTLRDSRSINAMLETDHSSSAPLMGSSDDHPLVLHGETVQAFKCLLSLLHASPYMLVALVDDLKKCSSFGHLISLLEVTRRHQFESTARLASDLLVDYLANFTDDLRKTADVNLLKRLLVVLVAERASILLDDFTRIFATRVLDKGIPPEVALEFADTHGLRFLQGAACYILLFSVTEEKPDAKLEPLKFELRSGNLDGGDAQLQRRLLHGYWSLMQYSQLLTKTPPLDIEVCETLKITKWYRQYTPRHKPALSHPLAMLEACKRGLIQFIDDYGRSLDLNRGLVIEAMDTFIEEFRDGLMDHFDPSK